MDCWNTALSTLLFRKSVLPLVTYLPPVLLLDGSWGVNFFNPGSLLIGFRIRAVCCGISAAFGETSNLNWFEGISL